jgi:hypothetical protein
MNKGQTLILQTLENKKSVYKKAEITYVWKDSSQYNIQFEDGNINTQVHLYPTSISDTCIIYTTQQEDSHTSVPKTISTSVKQPKKKIPSKPKSRKPYSCYQCSHVARNSRDLELHQWQEHPSNKYERAWASRKGSRGGFYDDDPYY